MATTTEVNRLFQQMTTPQAAPAQNFTPIGAGSPSLAPPSGQSGRLQQVGFYNLYQDMTTGAFMTYNQYGGIQPATNAEIIAVQKALEADTGGDGGDGGAYVDPVMARLDQQQAEADLAARLGTEARAAEMQPYDIAASESTVRYQDAEAEIGRKNLERELLKDKFDRAQETFNAAQLAEQLSLEKKKTATTLLSSIVDNIIPPGQEFLPGLEPGRSLAFPQGVAPPRVAQINWNQLGPDLDPQTDQALQYLLGLQQQNQGV